MVRHCLNPACHAEFTLFHTGYLYAHERQFENTEFIWLCSSCGSQFVPYLDADNHISLMPRSSAQSPRPPRVDGYLRLLAAPMQRNLWSSAVPAGLRRQDPPARTWEVPVRSDPGNKRAKDKSSAA